MDNAVLRADVEERTDRVDELVLKLSKLEEARTTSQQKSKKSMQEVKDMMKSW